MREAGPSRRAVLLALASTAALGAPLAGCARIPRSGEVREGGAVEAPDDPGYRVEPVGPVDGATPEEVVRGFLAAGVGVEDDFRTARAFLTPERRSSWRPTALTAVHPAASLQLEVGAGEESGGGPVEVRLIALLTAEVDPAGRYRPAEVGEALDVTLTLVRDEGQLRISDAPDLLLLDEARFRRTFALRPVVFTARADAELLVPDLRWLLDRTSTATTLVEEVLAGPPAWLAPAVTSGAPDGTLLPSGSVVVSGGVATVDLPASLQRRGTPALRQLQRQLASTLGDFGSSASQVVVTLDGGALPPASAPSLVTGSAGDDPVLVADGQLVRLTGGQLQPLAGLPVLPGASSPAVLGDQVVVLLEGRTQVLRLVRGADDAVAGAPVVVGTDLTPPSLDRYGWAWSTPAESDGRVYAVAGDGRVAEVAAPWLAGRRVVEMRAALDGARVLVTSSGGAGLPDTVRVDITGVSRTGAGTPVALIVDPTPPTPWLVAVQGAVWVGPTSAAVLGVVDPASAQAASATDPTRRLAGTAPAVWLLEGGRATDLGGPPQDAGAVRIAGGTSRQSLVVGGSDGRVWPREGSRWLALAGVSASDPAFPG